MRDDSSPWVVRALGGDKRAFSELVERYRRVAAAVAYGILGDAHLAADAVQEAFFKAYQGLAGLKDPQRFAPWFLAIVRSTATDMVRRRVRWGSREVPMGEGLDEGGLGDARPGVGVGLGPQESLLQEEEAVRIRAALRSLPDDYREVIVLKHLEGHSYQEIAGLLKTSVRAVESRLFRARQQLSRVLGQRRPVNGRRVDEPSEIEGPPQGP